MTPEENDEFIEYKSKMAEIGKPFYRFNNGTFIKAASFDEAKRILIAEIETEKEKDKNWHACTCLGLGHVFGCPVDAANGIPF
jgi:hypothetical protein